MQTKIIGAIYICCLECEADIDLQHLVNEATITMCRHVVMGGQGHLEISQDKS